MNIYEKLLAITAELTKVAKNLQVGEGKFAYKAVGEADILAAVRPLEEKYKVYSYPYARNVIDTGELETKTGTKNLFLRIETIYRFVNVEKPDEYIDITSYGDGVDSQDKSVGKAMTYSDKYALMKAYKIMTGDDPDQTPSEELKGKTKPTYQKPQQPQQGNKKEVVQPNTPQPPKEPEVNKEDLPFPYCTQEQLEILNRQAPQVKAFALKKYNVANLGELSIEQAKFIIDSLQAKGTLK